MTSNRPIEEWGKLLHDVPAATAIIDRFLHRAEVIQITGRSYRLKDAALARSGLGPKAGAQRGAASTGATQTPAAGEEKISGLRARTKGCV